MLKQSRPPQTQPNSNFVLAKIAYFLKKIDFLIGFASPNLSNKKLDDLSWPSWPLKAKVFSLIIAWVKMANPFEFSSILISSCREN